MSQGETVFGYRARQLCQASALVLTLSMFSAASALAQTTQPPARQQPGSPVPSGEEPVAASIDDVIVTGSRIVRDGYEAPSPTTVIGLQDIEAAAPANLADFVNRLPQLGGTTTPRTTGAGVGGGTGGANFLNMRALGASRTLVLLNGNRVVPAATTGAVDLNLLPTALVERVDVVTGGASAAYGSDAVAGVVNFILDNDFTGMKGNIQTGISQEGDGQTYNAELSFGTPFADRRGHLLFSGQVTSIGEVAEAGSRDWFRGYKLIGNPSYTLTNGQPALLLLPNVGLGRATPGGLIGAGPLRGTAFGPGGALQTFTYGSITSGNIMSGGTPYELAAGQQLQAPVEQYSLFTRASFDLSDAATAYVEASYGHSDVTSHSSPYVRHGNITIRAGNPYIPTALNMTGITSFSLGRTNEEFGLPDARNIREMSRGVIGIDGTFGETWRWSAYYQYGQVGITNTVSNNPIVARYDLAVDVVRNPAVGGVAGVAVGDPVCRSTLTSPGNGCQPFNPFGFGSPSQASLSWISGVARQDIEVKQEVAAANVQFEPFSIWAGPVSVAAGAEWRKESYVSTTDALSITNSFWLGNYKPGGGEYSVKEIYAEVIAPLVRDLPFIQSLDFNGAVRSTEYSTSGNVTTWKAGLTYDVNDTLRFRGTRSRDIRAPNLNDLFLGGQANSNSVQDVLQPGAPSVFITTLSGGNPFLTPEVAETTAYGFVFRPAFLEGFSMSLDYFEIDIADAIVNQGAAATVNQCYGFGVPQIPAACSAITLATPGTLVGAVVRTSGINLQSLSTSGYDFEVSYQQPVSNFVSSWEGDLTLRLVGARTTQYETVLAGAVTDSLNMLGNALEWRWLATAGYTLGPSRTTFSLRYVGPAVYNNLPVGNPQSVDQNDIDDVAYLDISQNYDLEIGGREVQLYGVIENVFNTDPPVVGGGGANNQTNFGASAQYHDTIGRSFRVGLRFVF